MSKNTQIQIGSRALGKGKPTYIIAEVGSNHNGSLRTAHEYIDLSAQAGVDAVKFQALERASLFSKELPNDTTERSKHNIELLKKRWDILPSFTADDSWWVELKQHCDEVGVDFLCTPFDLKRLHLINDLEVKAFKIASGDITWHELLAATAETNKPVVLSTGASTLDEVRRAVSVLKKHGCNEIALLHCVSNYPPKWKDANLQAIETLEKEFQVPVGLSDHSPGTCLAIAAVTLGACIIEKHITIDKSLPGLDHHFAMEAEDFARLVENVRHTESALGNGIKNWVADEEIERYWVRRGVWANQGISCGEVLTRDKLKIVRPAHGISADEIDHVVGKIATRDISAEEPISLDCLS